MPQHAAAGRPNACKHVAPNNVAFKCCDQMPEACKCWVNNVGICCVQMYVAIIWPGLANAGPTMLGYVELKCCNRLVGA